MREDFTDFCKKYENHMYYIANDILKDNDLAEDVVQTVLSNIYKNCQRVIGMESIRENRYEESGDRHLLPEAREEGSRASL